MSAATYAGTYDANPRPPANAYFIVASMLPKWYFTTAPPLAGVEISAVGRDRVETRWRVETVMAEALIVALRKHADIVSCVGTVYRQKGQAA